MDEPLGVSVTQGAPHAPDPVSRLIGVVEAECRYSLRQQVSGEQLDELGGSGSGEHRGPQFGLLAGGADCADAGALEGVAQDSCSGVQFLAGGGGDGEHDGQRLSRGLVACDGWTG